MRESKITGREFAMRCGRPTALAVLLTLLLVADASACGYRRHAEPHGPKSAGQRGALVIGDSTMIFAAPLIGRHRMEADAKECRQFADGLAMVSARKRAGTLPHLVVLALGANGPVSVGGLEHLLRILGRRHVLALVTPRNQTTTQASMRTIARRRPLRVLLMDWRRHSDGHGGWFGGDGIHPTATDGAHAFAAFIAHRAAPVIKPPTDRVRLPRRVAGTKACGVRRRGLSRYAIRVISGRARMTCARARQLVTAAPFAGITGWSWADWRPLRASWLEVYRRSDGKVIVATTAVPRTSAAAAASCRATAARLRRALPNYAVLRPYSDIGEQVCFDFTGDGRRDVVLTRWEFMNHGAHLWVAYRGTRSGYKRVARRSDCCRIKKGPGTGLSLDRDGSRILVTQPVYAEDDPLCCPSQGSRTGRWAWVDGHLARVGVTRDP